MGRMAFFTLLNDESMRTKLFNCEVIALVIASCLLSLGIVASVQAIVTPVRNQITELWEHCALLSLALGLISGSAFWLIRRFLNRM